MGKWKGKGRRNVKESVNIYIKKKVNVKRIIGKLEIKKKYKWMLKPTKMNM